MKHIRLAIPNKKILSGTILYNFSKLDVLQVDCKISTSRNISRPIEKIEEILRNTARRVHENYVLDMKRNRLQNYNEEKNDGFRLLRSQSDDFARNSMGQDETTPWRNRMFG